MSLTEYKSKRSFARTPEPSGDSKKKMRKDSIVKPQPSKQQTKSLSFVVQKHHASHLHYDFRLEMRGVLKSWAVPKGPSMNPNDKRLAMLVEDHPFDYKDFEGIIPEGNYGAGVVIVWDQGTYTIAENEEPQAQQPLGTNKIKKKNESERIKPTVKRNVTSIQEQEKLLIKNFYAGRLRIKLNGKKLKGAFVLIRAPERGETSWLLIKEKDQFAKSIDISKKDRSVISGKSIDELRDSKDARKWISNRSAEKKEELKASQEEDPEHFLIADEDERDYQQLMAEGLEAAKKKKRASMPKNISPMLATSYDKPFDDPEWIYEVKWDGYRALAYINKRKAELKSRNNNSFNEKFFPVYEAVRHWPVNAVVDGEVVLVNEEGLSQFHQLEEWKDVENGELVYYVFDLLWLNGYDLRHLPLVERRNILQLLVPEDSAIRFSESFPERGTEFFASAEKLGIEGIIAKKADSTYVANSRTRNWLKIKTKKRHEVVIAGYTLNEGRKKDFSALIAGVYNDKNELTFIGQIGTGFTDKVKAELLKKMKPLEIKNVPFKEEPVINKPTQFRPKPPKTEVHWLKPQLVCEVSYQELKPGGIMRHASFQGMRTDKAAEEVKGTES
jgi:bifunctional non-homologous end joining protein LigD